MNNKVKPQVGQVWECTKKVFDTIVGELVSIERDNGLTISIVDQAMHDIFVGYSLFNDSFKFIPANDLEWLAVKAINISEKLASHKGYAYAYRNNDDIIFSSVILNDKSRSISDIKECRHQLGLDERPKQEVEIVNNKVKPQAGQVFKCVEFGAGQMLKGTEIKISKRDIHGQLSGVIGSSLGNVFLSDDYLSDYFEFVPANDLEWMAVNSYPWNPVITGRRCGGDHYSKQQWQECRYKLGLDDRPQEEVKMFDLSGAVKEAQFESECKRIFTVAYVGEKESYWCMESATGRAYIFDRTGIDDVASVRLVKKHDPRPWLSELPDASMFELYETEFIECTNGNWSATRKLTGYRSTLEQSCMPELTDGQRINSKISIADLAKWQAENK